MDAQELLSVVARLQNISSGLTAETSGKREAGTAFDEQGRIVEWSLYANTTFSSLLVTLRDNFGLSLTLILDTIRPASTSEASPATQSSTREDNE